MPPASDRPASPTIDDDSTVLADLPDEAIEDELTSPPIDPVQRPPSLTADGRLATGRLAGLTMSRAIWVLSWPILVQSFLDSTVGLVDTSLAAHLGVAATDAVGSAAYIMWFIGVIVMAVGVGATALISRAIGASDIGLAERALGQAVGLSIGIGALGGAGLLILAPFVGRWFNLSPEAALHMRNYLIPMGLGLPATVITFIGIACMRGAGDAMRPLWVMVIVNIINIPLSWALSGATIPLDLGGPETVLAAPAWPALGVAGVGAGTAFARSVGAVLIVLAMARGTHGMWLHRRAIKPEWPTMRRLLRISVPNLWESLGMWVGNLLIMLIVGWIVAAAMNETGLIGVHMITIRVEAFSFLPGLAMGSAAATLVGQYLGAGSPELAKRSASVCASIGAAIMAAFGAIFIIWPDELIGLVSEQELHLELAPRLLWIIGWAQIPLGLMLILRNAMRGAGDTKMTMRITWLSIYGVRLPACFIAATLVPERGLQAIWVVMAAELTIRAALFLARFVHGGWTRIDV